MWTSVEAYIKMLRTIQNFQLLPVLFIGHEQSPKYVADRAREETE